MPTHVALLRGVNIGPRNRVAMPALRELAADLGLEDAATYVQSGNLVFTTSRKSTARLAGDLRRAIEERFAITAPVIVLTRDELAAVHEANPYPGEEDPKKVHAVFFAEPPGTAAEAAIAEAAEKAGKKLGRDAATVAGQAVYIHTPDGFGRSEFVRRLFRKGFEDGTARNWSSVSNLLGLLDG